MYETGQDRNYSPRNHDSCYPLSRTPAFDDDGSRYLEQNISQVKHADAETVDAVAEAEVGAHSEIRKRDVDAIQISNYVEQEN